MECFIYKASKKEALYLYVRRKDDFSEVPEALLKSMGEPEYVMPLALTPERTLAREDPVIVRKNLIEKGFHVQLPPTHMPIHMNLQ